MSYIVEVELIVPTGKLDVENEGKTEVMEVPWVSSSISFVDGMPFTKLVPLTQQEGAIWGKGIGEKMMISALVMLSLSWNIQVEVW